MENWGIPAFCVTAALLVAFIIYCIKQGILLEREEKSIRELAKKQRDELTNYWWKEYERYQARTDMGGWRSDDLTRAQRCLRRHQTVLGVPFGIHLEVVKRGEDWTKLYPLDVFMSVMDDDARAKDATAKEKKKQRRKEAKLVSEGRRRLVHRS